MGLSEIHRFRRYCEGLEGVQLCVLHSEEKVPFIPRGPIRPLGAHGLDSLVRVGNHWHIGCADGRHPRRDWATSGHR